MLENETATADPDPVVEQEVAESPSVDEVSSSASEALTRAFDDVFGDDEDDIGSEASVSDAPARERDENGRFKAKEAPSDAETEAGEEPAEAPDQHQEAYAAPERFSPVAKEAWKTVPDEVKAEVHRAIGEMTQGIEKYRQDATQWQELTEFQQMAAEHGVTIKDTLANYVRADQMLGQDLLGGLDHIAQTYGYTLEQIAAHVMQQEPRAGGENVQEINSLKSEIQSLKQQLSGVQTTFQSQQVNSINEMTTKFAAEHPRYAELEPAMVEMIQTGFAKGDTPEARLRDAYAKAEKLNPAPKAPEVPTPPKSAQTVKGNLSVTGAPGSGSNPANRKPPSSAREALDGAFDSLGL